MDELTFTVREGGAAGFNHLVRPGDSHEDTTLRRWTDEVVPAVREAVGVARETTGRHYREQVTPPSL